MERKIQRAGNSRHFFLFFYFSLTATPEKSLKKAFTLSLRYLSLEYYFLKLFLHETLFLTSQSFLNLWNHKVSSAMFEKAFNLVSSATWNLKISWIFYNIKVNPVLQIQKFKVLLYIQTTSTSTWALIFLESCFSKLLLWISWNDLIWWCYVSQSVKSFWLRAEALWEPELF